MSSGSNSGAGGIAAGRLRSFIERIERLEEEKAALTADIREVYSEAKGEGFDTKVMRQIVRERKMDPADRQEQESILDLYRRALGMLADTPLGAAAIERAGEQIDPDTGEVTAARAPELPDDPFEAANQIVAQAGYGKVKAQVIDRDAGRFELVKSKAARGSVGQEIDDAHFALLEAGYHHVGGILYATPDHPPQQEAQSAATGTEEAPAAGEPDMAGEGV